MIEREKIQLLAQINKSMIDAEEMLEEALKRRDADSVSKLKSYLLDMQKRFSISLQELK